MGSQRAMSSTTPVIDPGANCHTDPSRMQGTWHPSLYFGTIVTLSCPWRLTTTLLWCLLAALVLVVSSNLVPRRALLQRSPLCAAASRSDATHRDKAVLFDTVSSQKAIHSQACFVLAKVPSSQLTLLMFPLHMCPRPATLTQPVPLVGTVPAARSWTRHHPTCSRSGVSPCSVTFCATAPPHQPFRRGHVDRVPDPPS